VTLPLSNVLLCDEERETTDLLARDLEELGHAVVIARSCADAFAAACAYDYDALVAAPFLSDGSALVLPRALGIRRPRLVVLVSRLTERLAQAIARHVGFDAQLTKIVDPRRLDRMLRASISASVITAEAEAPPPPSEVGARAPR
jgi:DNA-binding response OmpR family regulator